MAPLFNAPNLGPLVWSWVLTLWIRLRGYLSTRVLQTLYAACQDGSLHGGVLPIRGPKVTCFGTLFGGLGSNRSAVGRLTSRLLGGELHYVLWVPKLFIHVYHAVC